MSFHEFEDLTDFRDGRTTQVRQHGTAVCFVQQAAVGETLKADRKVGRHVETRPFADPLSETANTGLALHRPDALLPRVPRVNAGVYAANARKNCGAKSGSAKNSCNAFLPKALSAATWKSSSGGVASKASTKNPSAPLLQPPTRANNRSSMPEPYGVKTPSHSSEPHCSPLLLHTHEGESELLRGVESRDRLIYPRR